MNKIPQQQTGENTPCPTPQKEYSAEGKKYIVTRSFTGDKNINRVMYGLAVSRADREAGI